ncbi:MAG: BlaI/MecI/CopY family transcriptional regulator [Lachnospiraceae bacterium]
MLKKLSDRQLEIMQLMWEENRPLIASEIVEIKDDLNINTVQASLRSLIKKGYITMAGIVYSGTVLCRTYSACVTKQDYLGVVCDNIGKFTDSGTLMASLIEKETSDELLDELEKMLAKRKKELKR